jgi:hypothetical protein
MFLFFVTSSVPILILPKFGTFYSRPLGLQFAAHAVRVEENNKTVLERKPVETCPLGKIMTKWYYYNGLSEYYFQGCSCNCRKLYRGRTFGVLPQESLFHYFGWSKEL